MIVLSWLVNRYLLTVCYLLVSDLILKSTVVHCNTLTWPGVRKLHVHTALHEHVHIALHEHVHRSSEVLDGVCRVSCEFSGGTRGLCGIFSVSLFLFLSFSLFLSLFLSLCWTRCQYHLHPFARLLRFSLSLALPRSKTRIDSYSFVSIH